MLLRSTYQVLRASNLVAVYGVMFPPRSAVADGVLCDLPRYCMECADDGVAGPYLSHDMSSEENVGLSYRWCCETSIVRMAPSSTLEQHCLSGSLTNNSSGMQLVPIRTAYEDRRDCT